MAGKRIKNAYKSIDKTKVYNLAEAVKSIKNLASAKFNETVDIAMNLNIDSRKSDQNLRGVTSLPHGTGKTYRIAVFARDAKAEDAKAAGADIVGAEDLMDSIQKGNMDFDRCIATPDMMGLVGRVGKKLGPRGLMPNPKDGTVTADVKAAVAASKAGQVQIRADKGGVVHSGIGKASFTEQQLLENIKAFVAAVEKARPSGVKGTYIKKISLSSTMGPSLVVEV